MLESPHHLLLTCSVNVVYLLFAYLVGSIPFGYLAGKMNGIDLREHGSKNIGATNTFRVLGKKWGIPVFICDVLKGLLPVLAMKSHLGVDLTACTTAEMGWLIGSLMAAVLGHTFTCFLKFKGGKGIATALGALIAFSPFIAGAALAVWLTCMVCTRYVSLSSILAAVGVECAILWQCLGDATCSGADIVAVSFISALVVLVIVKHRSNVTRLLNGTEPRAFSKKK